MQEKMQTKCNKHTAEAGFTLVEVMVTMVIIGLMTVGVVIKVLPVLSKAKIQAAEINISSLSTALEQYRLDMGVYPDTLAALEAQASGSNDARYRVGGYIVSVPLDPWEHEYNYVFPGDHGAYDLSSLGADGEEGGEELNADITNWKE